VDAELRKTTDPKKVDGIHRFIHQHEKNMISPPLPTPDEIARYPPKLKNDRYILSDAVKTGTDVIVTNDKQFCRQGSGYGPAMMRPKEYLTSRKQKK